MARIRKGFRNARLGALPGEFSSLGATLWEWLNPEQVAAEYEAVGKEAPPPVDFSQVVGAAVEDTRDVVVGAGGEIIEGAQQIGAGAQKIVFAAAVGVALAAVVYFSQKGRRK